MYFSNIANDELNIFNKSIIQNTLSFTSSDIPNSGLFKTEQIVNFIYRVYPLFYCDSIESSNSSDKIFDNRCLIMNLHPVNPDIITFKGVNTDNIIFNEKYIKTKNINSKLSVSEFNSFIYLLRKNKSISFDLDFNNTDNIKTEYATFKLNNVDGKLCNDKGFIINQDIREKNQLNVSLINPVFRNANYYLKCKVKSITGANIAKEDTVNFITEESFNILLNSNVPTVIDLNKYTDDTVLLFNMGLSIDFNIPEIVLSDFVLNLTSNVTDLNIISESFKLIATLNGNTSSDGYVVNFYKDGNFIGNSVFEEGTAILDYIQDTEGVYTYTAKCLGLKDNITVRTGKYDTNIHITVDKSKVLIPDSFTLTGVLSNEKGVLKDKSVKIYNNNTLLDTMITDNNGAFSKIINVNSVNEFNLKAVFESDNINKYSESNTVKVVSDLKTTNLTLKSSKSSVYYSETINYTGVLTDELNNRLANKTVKIYENNSLLKEVKTNNNGEYSFNRGYASVGSFTLYAMYDGDNTEYKSINSASVTVNILKAPVNINVVENTNTIGDYLDISVSSNYGVLNADKISVEIYDNNNLNIIGTKEITLTDNKGKFQLSYQHIDNKPHTYNIKYNGTTYYNNTVKSISPVIATSNINKITGSYSNENIIFKFETNNNMSLSNARLLDATVTIEVWMSSASKSPTISTITLDDFILNANGELKIGTKLVGAINKVTLNYNGLTSNFTYYNG